MESARSTERELLRDSAARHGSEHRQATSGDPPKIIIPCASDGTIDAHAVRELEAAKASATHYADLFQPMLLELMLTLNPGYKREPAKIEATFVDYHRGYVGQRLEDLVGSFVAYPNGTLLRILPEDDHYKLRTSRNIGLFTAAEQMRLRNARIAVVGLSVGGAISLTLAMEGIKTFFLTDFDQLACSNLNRLASSLSMIGIEKTKIIAGKIWDIDPFAKIVTSDRGFTQGAEAELFTSIGKPDVVIDAMDSVEAKIALRAECRKNRIALISVLDIGDGIVQVDTERYDVDPSYPAFHGVLDRLAQLGDPPPSYVESAFNLFNQNYLPFRMAKSFSLACNNEWAGISQLAGTVSIAAGAVARTARKIILGESVIPQFVVDIDEKADPDYASNKAADRAKTAGLIEAATPKR